MHNMTKYLHTFNSGLICTNKAARQLLCSSLLFCFRKLKRFLEISVRDPQKILRVSWNSKLDPRNLVLEPRNLKLEPRNSILDSRKLWGSSFESGLSTYIWAVLYYIYNCKLNVIYPSLKVFIAKVKATCQIEQKIAATGNKLVKHYKSK